MATYNDNLADQIRRKFRLNIDIQTASNPTIIAAYTCWSVCHGQDWNTFPDLLSAAARKAAWARVE